MNVIGKIVRYADGPTALMRVDHIRDIGGGHTTYYGRHCMGGSYSAPPYRCTLADDVDLAKWNECTTYRGSEKRSAVEGDI